jgi:hypothetical protein
VLAGQQAFHGDACKDVLLAVDAAHVVSFPRVGPVKGGGTSSSKF